MIPTTSLDGTWSFWPDLHRRLPTGPGAPFVSLADRVAALGEPRTVAVPTPWQAAFADLRLWAGTAWYERPFVTARRPSGGRLLLRFGAVDYFASVWVNGHLAGEHEGGYLPFSFDLTDLIRGDGENVVTMRVLDVGPDDADGPFPFAEIPHGKQSWYGPIGGPWQSVTLEARGSAFVERTLVDRADPATGEVAARIRLDRGTVDVDAVRWRIVAPDGSVAVAGEADPVEALVRAEVREPFAWDLASPNLYVIEAEVTASGKTIDRHAERFGFRSVGVADGRVTLNGRPIYLLGALDQDYWMPRIAAPQDGRELDEQAQRAKELGLNLLRCHIKVPDPRYLDAADRAGMLVWCEPPNWIDLTPDADRRLHDTLEGMVERDLNHPSLIIRSIVNEDWGTDLVENADHRRWLAETSSWLRSLDPTRLVIDNSACPPNFHVGSDLNDYHLYRSVPEQTASWRAWIEGWVRDPASTFSPNADSDRTGEEPLLLSEFGIWGLPDVEALIGNARNEPWWFTTSSGSNEGITLPAGVHERFETRRLGATFGSFASFVRESQEHAFEGLKMQIEDLRSHGEIAGYVITELTDVHWEANGLLDMRRRRKALHDRFRLVNAPHVVIVRPESNRCRAGATIRAEVRTVGPSEEVEGRVRWRLDGFDVGGEAEGRDGIAFAIPEVGRPTRTALIATWRAGDGTTIAEGGAPLWLFPHRDATPSAGVTIGRAWADVEASVADGGRALILVDDASDLPDRSIALEPFAAGDDEAAASIYGNGWVMSTGMGWLAPRITDGLAIGPRVDLAFEGMTPRWVLDGYDAATSGDVLAGHYLGWIHHVRATIATFAHRRGAGIVCTFPLLEHDDPLGSTLVARLTEIAASPDFAPTLQI